MAKLIVTPGETQKDSLLLGYERSDGERAYLILATRRELTEALAGANQPLLAAMAGGAVPYGQLHEGARFQCLNEDGTGIAGMVWTVVGPAAVCGEIQLGFDEWELVIPV